MPSSVAYSIQLYRHIQVVAGGHLRRTTSIQHNFEFVHLFIFEFA